jgi:hypothetical protein
MEAVIVAIITAIASISVALIEAVSALKIAGIKAQPAPEPVSINRLGTSAKALNTIPAQPFQETVPANRRRAQAVSPNRTWLWVSGLLVISNLLWQVVLPYESGYVIHLAAIPWCTGLLAYFRPIRWTYVAGVVTLLSLIPVLTASFIVGHSYDSTVIPILAFVFTANAVVAAGIAYQRQRTFLAD